MVCRVLMVTLEKLESVGPLEMMERRYTTYY